MPKQPKILLWDIESTGLKASFGTILCIGYKWLDQKTVHVPTILDYSTRTSMMDDGGLVKDFVDVFNSADMHVTWYGERFDLPMLRSKLLMHGMHPPAPVRHLDLWKTARYKFNMHSNRLVTWQQILKSKHEKTDISFDDWLHAAHGNKKALNVVKHHCKMDVLVLEDIFLKLRPWLSQEPNRGLLDFAARGITCQSCGSNHVTKQGRRLAKTRSYQQWKCKIAASG